MSTDEDALRTLARDTIEALVQWRDEARLKIHLGGMDASVAWHAAESHVETAEARLRTVLDDAIPTGGRRVGADLRRALHDARETLRKIRPNLDAIGSDLSKAGNAILGRLDRDVDAPHS